jgi:hypothetical protein
MPRIIGFPGAARVSRASLLVMGLVLTGTLTLASAVRAQGFVPMGSGPNASLRGTPMALAVYNGETYAAGAALSDPSAVGNNIEKWNGTAWVSVGVADANVHALAVYNGELYAAGDFTSVGTLQVNGIAKWNGSAWSDPESGMNGTVQTLGVWNGLLIAGGYFTSANGPANYIASWDGNRWSALGSGTNAQVMGLGTWAGKLVAVGFFGAAGGVSAMHVALWDGTAWSAAGAGVSNVAYSATSWNGELVVGGLFTAAGGIPVSNIARWNGTTWAPMGAGLGGLSYGGNYVFAFQEYFGRLYAGGAFIASGSVAMSNLAAWNGTSWEAGGWGLSYGVSNSSVVSLAANGNDLIAAGIYTGSVLKYTSLLASVGPAAEPSIELSAPSPNPSRGASEVSYALPRAGEVEVAVFDLSGRRVRTLVSARLVAGPHVATWDGRDERAALAPSGAYVVRLVSGGVSASRKLVRVR